MVKTSSFDQTVENRPLDIFEQSFFRFYFFSFLFK